RSREPMILAVGVGAQHINHVRITCGTKDALVIPTLARAKIVGGVARIRDVATRLLGKSRGASLDRLGDPEAAVWRAAVAFSLIHTRMSIRCGCNGELATVGVEAARDLARVN